MMKNSITVEIRQTTRPGALKAHADVTYSDEEGSFMLIRGFPIIQKDGKPPFVGMPSRQGTTPGKYFKTVELEGDVKERTFRAILERYASLCQN